MKLLLQFITGFLKHAFSKKPVSNTPTVKEKPLEVINSVNTLEWHKSRTWSKRPLSKINKIVVHQSLTTGSLTGINSYHIKPGKDNHISPKGAPHICYHYAIDQKGVVHQCNHLSSLVWHTKGQNTSGIGIVVLGNFEGPTYKGTNSPTDTQIKNTNRLIDLLLKKTDIKIESSEIYGHADFGKENCPGNKVYTECVESRRK